MGTVLIFLIGAANRFCFITKYRLSAVVFAEISADDDAHRGARSVRRVRWSVVEKLRDLKKRLLGFWVLKGAAGAAVDTRFGKLKSWRYASSEDSHSTKDDRTSRLASTNWPLLTLTAPAASAKREGCVLKTLVPSPAGV